MANRRFLKSNESEQSVRQRAFEDGIKGFAEYGDRAMKNIESKKATDRQRAMEDFKTSLQLTEMSGERVTTDQVKEFRNNKFQEFNEDGQQTSLGKFYSNLDEKREQKRRNADKERALDTRERMGKVDVNEYIVDQNKKGFRQRQEAEKMRLASELRANEARANSRSKKKDDQRLLGAKGYNIPSNTTIMPTQVEARQFRDALGNADAFKTNINNVGKIIQENKGVPSAFLSPNIHKKMQQEITKAKLDLKGEAFFKLGVLAGPDMELIDKTFGDIDSLFSTYQPNNEKIALEKLQSLIDYVDNKIKTKASNLGYVADQNDSVNSQMAGQRKQAPAASQLSRAEKIKALRGN